MGADATVNSLEGVFEARQRTHSFPVREGDLTAGKRALIQRVNLKQVLAAVGPRVCFMAAFRQTRPPGPQPQWESFVQGGVRGTQRFPPVDASIGRQWDVRATLSSDAAARRNRPLMAVSTRCGPSQFGDDFLEGVEVSSPAGVHPDGLRRSGRSPLGPTRDRRGAAYLTGSERKRSDNSQSKTSIRPSITSWLQCWVLPSMRRPSWAMEMDTPT